MLILMGIFSMYTGLLYNECFSIPIDLCGTMWTYDPIDEVSVNASVWKVSNYPELPPTIGQLTKKSYIFFCCVRNTPD